MSLTIQGNSCGSSSHPRKIRSDGESISSSSSSSPKNVELLKKMCRDSRKCWSTGFATMSICFGITFWLKCRCFWSTACCEFWPPTVVGCVSNGLCWKFGETFWPTELECLINGVTFWSTKWECWMFWPTKLECWMFWSTKLECWMFRPTKFVDGATLCSTKVVCWITGLGWT